VANTAKPKEIEFNDDLRTGPHGESFAFVEQFGDCHAGSHSTGVSN
jgi:hypothetical protein